MRCNTGLKALLLMSCLASPGEAGLIAADLVIVFPTSRCERPDTLLAPGSQPPQSMRSMPWTLIQLPSDLPMRDHLPIPDDWVLLPPSDLYEFSLANPSLANRKHPTILGDVAVASGK